MQSCSLKATIDVACRCMAYSRRPHTSWKNYHRYYSRNDTTDKLDAREPLLFSRKLYLFICRLISRTPVTSQLSYLMFHWVTGMPFDSELHGGAYDDLTLWEQIDDGAQYTPAKKWLLSVPIVLYVFHSYPSQDPLFTDS